MVSMFDRNKDIPPTRMTNSCALPGGAQLFLDLVVISPNAIYAESDNGECIFSRQKSLKMGGGTTITS